MHHLHAKIPPPPPIPIWRACDSSPSRILCTCTVRLVDTRHGRLMSGRFRPRRERALLRAEERSELRRYLGLVLPCHVLTLSMILIPIYLRRARGIS